MITFAVLVVALVATGWSGWLVFARIGEPGWLFLVPGFNALAIARRAQVPLWLVPLCWVPIVRFPTSLLLYCRFVRALGRPAWLGIGVATLPFVFLPILAWQLRPVTGAT